MSAVWYRRRTIRTSFRSKDVFVVIDAFRFSLPKCYQNAENFSAQCMYNVITSLARAYYIRAIAYVSTTLSMIGNIRSGDPTIDQPLTWHT